MSIRFDSEKGIWGPKNVSWSQKIPVSKYPASPGELSIISAGGITITNSTGRWPKPGRSMTCKISRVCKTNVGSFSGISRLSFWRHVNQISSWFCSKSGRRNLWHGKKEEIIEIRLSKQWNDRRSLISKWNVGELRASPKFDRKTRIWESSNFLSKRFLYRSDPLLTSLEVLFALSASKHLLHGIRPSTSATQGEGNDPKSGLAIPFFCRMWQNFF